MLQRHEHHEVDFEERASASKDIEEI